MQRAEGSRYHAQSDAAKTAQIAKCGVNCAMMEFVRVRAAWWELASTELEAGGYVWAAFTPLGRKCE